MKSTRKEFLSAGAATAAGAAVAAFGFNRMASAQADMDKMITQTASFTINMDNEEEAVNALATLVKAVEKDEPGVLAYICHREADDPSKAFFYEIYKDEEALKAHGQTPHMAEMRKSFGTLLLPPVKITRMDKIEGFHR